MRIAVVTILTALAVVGFVRSSGVPLHSLTKRAATDFGWQPGNWAYNCDFLNKDLSNVRTSADQCGPTCVKTNACTHYTWSNYQGGTCWLKTGGATKNDAIVATDTVCGVILPISWQAENYAFDCDFPGNDVSSTVTASWDSCQKACWADGNCNHFTWNGGTCYLKNNKNVKKADAQYLKGAVCGTETWGFVMAKWLTNAKYPIVSMTSRVVVPPVPDVKWRTLFLWPGLEPWENPNLGPLGFGVMQPVLTYGGSCAPNNNPSIDKSNTWWISAQYVGSKCFGGEQMAVSPGDTLLMVMYQRSGEKIWDQIVLNEANGKSVTFSFDMQGQEQTMAMWVLEPPNLFHADPPKFTVKDINIQVAGNPPDSHDFCRNQYFINPEVTGARVECSAPVRSGNSCTIPECRFNGA